MNILLNLLSEGFADSSFARLFTDMNWWTAAIFAVGLVFCIIEMCIPGFGVCGISGVILVITGIVLRMIFGGDLLMLLYMVLISLVLFILMFWVFSRLITKSKLAKTALFHADSTVPTGITEGTKNFSALLNAVGVADTPLHPVGKAHFDGESIDVVARDGYISKGAAITVVAVEGQRVVVIENKEE